MDEFSIRGAWGYGLQFLRGRLIWHVLILLVMGILPVYALPLAIGESFGSAPATPLNGQYGVGTMPAGGAAAVLVMAVGYVLQSGSYFASWRLGLDRTSGPVGAIGFGLLAALLTMTLCVLLVVGTGFVAGSMASGGAWLLGVLIFLLPLAVLFAIFFTVFAALFATAAALALVLAMAFGAATGNIGLAATLVGGSGMITVVFLVTSVVLLWLAARFSCATSIMAERRSVNIFAAVGESWRLTLEDQWAILRYLALIAFALALILLGFGMAAGVALADYFQGAALHRGGPVEMIAGIALGLPFALLTVFVPAGIYRELEQSAVTAEVFA